MSKLRSGRERKNSKNDKKQSQKQEDDDAKSSITENLTEDMVTDGENKENFLLDTSMKMQVDFAQGLEVNEAAAAKEVRRSPGYVLSVGENVSNQLGLGEDITDRKKPQVVKLLPTNIVQAVSGGMHSACLTADGIVYTFGCNDEFALGRENSDSDVGKVELSEKIIQISAGDSHTAALGQSGLVYVWGTFRDGNGILGGESEKKIAKTPFIFHVGVKVVKISSGSDHLVVLTVHGQVYTAGSAEQGQLGRVSRYSSIRGGRRGCDIILKADLIRFERNKLFRRLKFVENIWTTPYCTFLSFKNTDTIVGFGLNNANQLGVDNKDNCFQPEILNNLKFNSKLVKVVGGLHHTLFLDSSGFVYSMGSHRYGSLGLGKIDCDTTMPILIKDLKNIIDIAANTNVSYAIDQFGNAYSWGTNYSKQLCHDDEEDYWSPMKITSKQVDIRDVYTASVGGQHTLFLMSEEKDKN